MWDKLHPSWTGLGDGADKGFGVQRFLSQIFWYFGRRNSRKIALKILILFWILGNSPFDRLKTSAKEL